ncbi:MAG: helix-turn-helix domain-containing protein [Clostridia bacterium]|nr:helix-turn-helix domain-containing protein [Clostridia bacterium]
MFKFQIGYYQNLFRGYPDLVSTKDMMKMLGIGKTFAYDLLKNKEIKSFKIGRHIKITKKEIVDYIRRKESERSINESKI